MSTKKYDSFKDLRKGKYDWKVPARALNSWKGYTRTGEAFKGYNLLLLDHKRARIHAFVPARLEEEVDKLVDLGKIYLIQNFTVKDYKADDKFRCLRKNIQIQFGEETIITQLQEEDISIEKTWFDFYDLAELKPLSTQTTYLTDVMGVMEKHDPIGKLTNRHGKVQSQLKFGITDGSTTAHVTLWDDFAELFSSMLKMDQEEYKILILGGARITKWGDEAVITHVHATTFYINYDIPCVHQLRKRIPHPSFKKDNIFKGRNRSPAVYKVKDIKELGEQYDETELICQVKIMEFEQVKNWFKPFCTSCYGECTVIGNLKTCSICNRTVPYAENRFELHTLASDETGQMKIILEDREVRRLIGKTALDLIEEGNKVDIFPAILDNLKNKFYSIKILIKEANTKYKVDAFLATDIIEGSYTEIKNETEREYPQPIQSFETHLSESSYHLDSAN
ncbi:uncharacterized protein LOC108213790 [Daucus carota subsp. sativus]|nr:PREDICTED: uncharacterized protein LOC108213790 [Daucus carota subsp. sativus]